MAGSAGSTENRKEVEEEISEREAGYEKRNEGVRHKGPHFHHSISKRHIKSIFRKRISDCQKLEIEEGRE